MSEPPEFWAFLIANSLLFVVGGILTGLSYRAFLRIQRPTLRIASGGFALITIGGLIELLYQVGIRQDYHLNGQEMLALQTVESIIITAGLAVLFYSIYRY